MSAKQLFQNPDLDGDSFFWKRGPNGVLLLHGFTATTAEIRPLGRSLEENGYTVMGHLLPGHGTTPEELNRCTWQDWVVSCESAFQELAGCCSQIWVGGELMGALLALFIASFHPDIAGILAFSPALIVPELRRARWLAPLVPIVKKRYINEKMAWKGYRVYPLRAAVQLLRFQKIVRERLRLIQQPILIVEGCRDRTIDLKSGEVILQQVQSTQKQLIFMENSSHCVLLDGERDRVTEITIQFLTSQAPVPAEGIA